MDLAWCSSSIVHDENDICPWRSNKNGVKGKRRKHDSRIILIKAYRYVSHLSDASECKLTHEWSLIQPIFVQISSDPLSISSNLLMIEPRKNPPLPLRTCALLSSFDGFPMINWPQTYVSRTSFFHAGVFLIFSEIMKIVPSNTKKTEYRDFLHQRSFVIKI